MKFRIEEIKKAYAEDIDYKIKCGNEENRKRQNDMSYITNEIENFVKEDVADAIINNLKDF